MGITNPTMEKTLSSQASDWREGRRLRAFELKERGWKQTEIADALGVSEGAVSQWMKRATEEGVEGLRHKRGVDMREGGTGDPKGVWGQLPPGSCEPFAQGVETEPAEA